MNTPQLSQNIEQQPLSLSVGGRASPSSDSESNDEELPIPSNHTTNVQTFVHLLKGSIGPGCLSLPWSFSSLGIPLGIAATFIMGFISSYNCLVLVRIKNDLVAEREQQHLHQHQQHKHQTLQQLKSLQADLDTNNVADQAQGIIQGRIDSQGSPDILTFSDVGEILYGRRFGLFVTACVCTLQLSICTVYFSFVGVNVMAVVQNTAFGKHDSFSLLDNYFAVVTMSLPAALALTTLIPNLKYLAPVTLLAALLLTLAFVLMGIMIALNWSSRPDQTPSTDWPKVPMAICPIMFAFEGICLVLPVESSMKYPRKFEFVYKFSMLCVCMVFVTFATACVVVFGHVDSGSITAFLMRNFDQLEGSALILAANAFVTFSVLFTYPLQMFPSIKLMAQILQTRKSINSEETSVTSEETFANESPLPDHESSPRDSTVNFVSIPTLLESNCENDQIASAPSINSDGDTLCLRTTLVLLTYIVAIAIPNVQELISLAGALAGASNALIIPPLLQLKHYSNRKQPISQMNKVNIYALLSLGIVSAVIGTVASIRDIIHAYATE